MPNSAELFLFIFVFYNIKEQMEVCKFANVDINKVNMFTKEDMFLQRVAVRWSRKAGVNPSSQWC